MKNLTNNTKKYRDQADTHIVKFKTCCEIAFLIFIIGLIQYFLFRNKTPIGYIENWDFLHHIYLIRKLAEGNFSLILSNISDTFTFNSYTPLFHVLIVIPTLLFKANILNILWWAELFHFAFTTFISYWAGKKIFRHQLGGLVMAIVSIFIFESQVAYTNLFLTPQTVAGTIGAALLINQLTSKKKFLHLHELIIKGAVVFMLHYIIGSVFIFLMLLVQFYKNTKSNKFKKLLLISSVIFLSISITMNLMGQKIILTDRVDAQHFIYTAKDLLGFLNQWYGFLPLLLIPIGLYQSLKANKETGTIIVFIVLFLTALSFTPFSYSLKFYTMNRYFVNIVIAIGILKIITYFNNRVLQYSLLIIIVTGLASVFWQNLNAHLYLSYNGKQNSYISDADIETANWLTYHYQDQKVFLISDPTTQAVFEALAGVNTQGGAFPRKDTVEKISSIYKENDDEKIYNTLLTVKDTIAQDNNKDVTLVVIGGRYFAWQTYSWDCKINYACQSWLPRKINKDNKAIIQQFTDNTYFQLVYMNDENVILSLKKR